MVEGRYGWPSYWSPGRSPRNNVRSLQPMILAGIMGFQLLGEECNTPLRGALLSYGWVPVFLDHASHPLHVMQRVGEPRLHGRCTADRLMDPHEVVVEEVERHGVDVVLDLLGVGVGAATNIATARTPGKLNGQYTRTTLAEVCRGAYRALWDGFGGRSGQPLPRFPLQPLHHPAAQDGSPQPILHGSVRLSSRRDQWYSPLVCLRAIEFLLGC